MNAERYNFARPTKLASELEQRLAAWLTTAAAMAPRKWAKVMPFELGVAPAPISTVRPAEVLEQLPETVVAYRIALPPESSTLFIVPRLFVLAVVAGLMGDSAGAKTQDREMTAVEESLFQYFLQTYWLPALREAWTGKNPLVPTLDKLETNVRWSRTLAGAEVVLSLTLTANGAAGEHACQWLVPQKNLVALLGETGQAPGKPVAPVKASSATMESMVSEIPVEIAVRLGTAELSFSQLTNLAVGDMVVLDQRISEPLLASVGEGCQFHGWAGRVGALRAFQIESLTSTQ